MITLYIHLPSLKKTEKKRNRKQLSTVASKSNVENKKRKKKH